MLMQPQVFNRVLFWLRRGLWIVPLALCCFFILPALLLGLLLQHYCASSWDHRERWGGVWISALLFGLVFIALFWWLRPFPSLFFSLLEGLRAFRLSQVFQSVTLLWGYGLLFVPVVALVAEALAPKTRWEQAVPRPTLAPARKSQRGRQIGLSMREKDVFSRIPGALGLPLGGDLGQWIAGGKFTYPLYALLAHAIVVGRSGMGKSELLRRIAYVAVRDYGMKVFWIDGKGDWMDAARFRLAVEAAGCQEIGIFPVLPHCGWRGARQDILNLLMSCQHFDNDYYQGVTYNILKMAFYAPGLPKIENSEELLRRIYPPTLISLYQGRTEQYYLEALTSEAIWGPHGRYTAFFNGVRDRLDGKKGFGDWDAGYYLLDKKRLQKQIAVFAYYLIEDFQLYLDLRPAKKERRPILLILDDYSAYSSMVSVFDLFERVRSAGGAVILAAQGYEGLGLDRDRLLEGMATTFLLRCNMPEPLLAVAGKRRVPEVSIHLREIDGEEDEETRSTIHMVEKLRVDPTDVRQLGRGEGFVLCDEKTEKLVIDGLGIDEDRAHALAERLRELYDQTQLSYEQEQVATQKEIPPTPQKQKGASFRRKRKHPAPQPPQPSASASHKSRSNGNLGAQANEAPLPGADRAGEKTEGTASSSSDGRPLSLDDIE